jgi:TRAP-type C4-dicarboxylate transport system permease large subunit
VVVAVNLHVARSLAVIHQIELPKVVVPFIVIMLLALAIIINSPMLPTFLPALFTMS